MDEQPLFGSGSGPSKHTKNKVAFLRPATTTNGRLHPIAEVPRTAPIPASPMNGTKAMRKVSTRDAPSIAHVNPQVQIPAQPPLSQPVTSMPEQPQMQAVQPQFVAPQQHQVAQSPVQTQPVQSPAMSVPPTQPMSVPVPVQQPTLYRLSRVD